MSAFRFIVRLPELMLRHIQLAVSRLLMCALVIATSQAAAQNTAPAWAQLPAVEQRALEPLQAQWPSMDSARRQKWREIAQRYPKLPIEQQERLRSRMVEWAAMSPDERGSARLRFEESKLLLPTEERRARWEAYQALPEEQRQQLLNKAELRKPVATSTSASSAAHPLKLTPGTSSALTQAQPKSNIVPVAPATAAARSIAPVTVQAAAGASTRTLTQRPAPPRHQHAGLPKIAATPEFIDSRTLLPQRGPQGVDTETSRAAP